MWRAISTDYSFRPVIAADLSLLRQWLEAPHVAEWWPDPTAQHAGLVDDLAGGRMVMLMVAFRGRDFAYSQHGNIHSWGADFARGLPRDSRALDSFIGDPDMVGLGHGARFLRQLANDLRRDYSTIAVDPSPDNIRAIRAFFRAGFVGDRIVTTPDGPARLMLFDD